MEDIDVQYILYSIGEEQITSISYNDMSILEKLIYDLKKYPYRASIIKKHIKDNLKVVRGSIRDSLLEVVSDMPEIKDSNILKKEEKSWLLYKTIKRNEQSKKAVIYIKDNNENQMTLTQRQYLLNMGIEEILYMHESNNEYIPEESKFKNINMIKITDDEDPEIKAKEMFTVIAVLGTLASLMMIK